MTSPRRRGTADTVSDVDGAADRSPSSTTASPGGVIVGLNAAGTALFVLTALAAAAFFTSGWQGLAAAVAIALFLVGIVAFLWAFWNAVQRSRVEQVAVTQLFLLGGGAAPVAVRRRMWALLAVQCVAGLGTALARPNAPDGSPGTSLALGVLVPVFGIGLNGLWAAFHGRFHERTASDVPTRDTSIGQNGDHG